jgi:hypothetical protein
MNPLERIMKQISKKYSEKELESAKPEEIV